MFQKVCKNAKSSVVLLASVLALSSLVLTGCGSGGGGSDSYDKPATTETAPINGAATEVLVDASTVANWIASGQVASAASFDRKVVILDYGDYSMDPAVDPERIQGSCRVTNLELASRRVEGVATAFPLVATGDQIDAVIQRLGIDENTTIVFTTSKAMYFPTRAYWTFRYWGFPTDQLKFLNGGTAAFAAAYPELMTREVPEPVASTFSVRDLEGLNDDLRLSIGEMLGLVSSLDDTTDVVLDARGPSNYSGLASSPGYVTGKVDLTVYDGHAEGVQYLLWKDLFVDAASGDYRFKTAAQLEELFATKGWSKDKMTTVYCLSGYSATPLYFAVETILGGKVRLYDGSWSQFGQYSDVGSAGGELPLGSPWASDQYLDLDGGYRYNIDYLVTKPLATEPLVIAEGAQATPFTADDNTSAADVVTSQMEVEDAAAAPAGIAAVAAPAATATDNVLIDAATLKSWQDAGLVNAAAGSERVVILDASTSANYAAAHIPGARWLDVGTENGMTRLDGVILAKNMMLTAEKMNALFQNHGIDANTTVVITTSADSPDYFPSRVYANLRYWGFPKANIKVLNGYNHAYATMLTTEAAPAAAETTLTVADLAGAQVDLRATLSEVMDAARDNRGMAIDFRGDGSKTGTTSALGPEGGKVVVEGRLNNGTFYARTNALNDDKTFKSATAIKADMAAAGIDVTSFTLAAPAISYCTSGYIASTGFFILDAILDVPVMIFDGSWSLMGQMSDNEAKGGMLASGDVDYSAWAVDSATYMSIINYNADHTNGIESLDPDAELLNLLPADTAANQVENADYEYQIESSGDSSTGDVAPPSAGGDTSVGC